MMDDDGVSTIFEFECGVIPKGPAVDPVVGSPVGGAEADSDLEHLCVHHMSHHAQKT